MLYVRSLSWKGYGDRETLRVACNMLAIAAAGSTTFEAGHGEVERFTSPFRCVGGSSTGTAERAEMVPLRFGVRAGATTAASAAGDFLGFFTIPCLEAGTGGDSRDIHDRSEVDAKKGEERGRCWREGKRSPVSFILAVKAWDA